ncbi:hypothetical protein [uncultured Corynebacterium sp.]|uniref:hypothetical protein n=1 Tax=Corynebacterium TaxID=1716 RepID=UPI00259A0F9E|nr:hypothetical protein [uncultured Corynebacterium sp.]
MWFQNPDRKLLEVLEGVLSGDLGPIFDMLLGGVSLVVVITIVPRLWVIVWELQEKDPPFILTKERLEKLEDRAVEKILVAVAAFALAGLLALLT